MPTGPILCVDDEPNNLALFRQILGEDYRLVFARDGDQALRAAEKHAPSLVLLDMEMPGMDMSGGSMQGMDMRGADTRGMQAPARKE